MRHVQALFLLTIVVVFTSCTHQSSAAKPTPTPTALPIPTPVHITMSPLSARDAWGPIHPARFPTKVGNLTFHPGGSSYQNTVSDDDQVCGVLHPPHDPTDPQDLRRPGMLALMDLHTGTITRLQDFPLGYYLTACATSGSWIIWTQSSPDDKNWQMKAINKQTNEVRNLDVANDKTPQAPYPAGAHGYAAWSTYAEDQKQVSAVVYNFASGNKTYLGEGTSFPLLAWPWFLWGDANQQAIVFKNMETSQQVLLPMTSVITSASFGAGAFVTANVGGAALTLYPRIDANMPYSSYVIANANKAQLEFVEYPTLNDRLVVWISNTNFTVFDRKTQRLVRMSDDTKKFVWPFISGHYLMWREPDPNDKNNEYLNVLDTNTLP